jgi:hypothetical protein
MASGAWGWKMFHHLVGSSLVDRIVVIIIDTCMHIYKYMRKYNWYISAINHISDRESMALIASYELTTVCTTAQLQTV